MEQKWLRTKVRTTPIAPLLDRASDLFVMVTSGGLQFVINRTYALEDATRAHSELESRATTESVVLVV